MGFPGSSEVKASAHNPGDLGSIPGLGRFPGEGTGNPLQYSCLENPMDRGAWWATVHRVAKSQTRLSDFSFTKRKVNPLSPINKQTNKKPSELNRNQKVESHQPIFKSNHEVFSDPLFIFCKEGKNFTENLIDFFFLSLNLFIIQIFSGSHLA